MITSRIQQSLYYTILHMVLIKQYSKQLQIPAVVIKNTVHWYSILKARKEARLIQKYVSLNGLVAIRQQVVS